MAWSGRHHNHARPAHSSLAFGAPVLGFPTIVVGSSNDPFVSIGRAMMFAYSWGARFVHLRDSGHINVESGFGPWPDGLRLARRITGAAARRRPHLHLLRTG
jgi:predicted alpha/beta hydrolase family esterase